MGGGGRGGGVPDHDSQRKKKTFSHFTHVENKLNSHFTCN